MEVLTEREEKEMLEEIEDVPEETEEVPEDIEEGDILEETEEVPEDIEEEDILEETEEVPEDIEEEDILEETEEVPEDIEEEEILEETEELEALLARTQRCYEDQVQFTGRICTAFRSFLQSSFRVASIQNNLIMEMNRFFLRSQSEFHEGDMSPLFPSYEDELDELEEDQEESLILERSPPSSAAKMEEFGEDFVYLRRWASEPTLMPSAKTQLH